MQGAAETHLSRSLPSFLFLPFAPPGPPARSPIQLSPPMESYSWEDLQTIFLMQGFAGISLFRVLLLMGLGLAVIFGQMGVINMAHGEFMALGAYTVYLCSTLTAEYAPSFGPYYFVVAIFIA